MDAYRPNGFVRHRATERYLWHDVGAPAQIPLPPMRGKIIESHQTGNTVDVRLSDGSIVRNVPLASTHAGTSYGSYRTPKITHKLDDRNPDGSLDVYDKSDVHDHYVIVQWMGGDGTTVQRPIVMASVAPEVQQLTNEKISQIDRSQHDRVELYLDDEHYTHYSPDFSGFTSGPDPEKWYPAAHDPGMEGPPDFDKRWKVINQDDKKHFLTLHQVSGQNTVMLHPNGVMQLHKGDGAGGTLATLQIHPDGSTTSFSAVGHTFDAPYHTFTGTLYANGGIECPTVINTTTLNAAGGAGPPSPLGGSGGPGSEGPVVSANMPLKATPANPNTGDRGYSGSSANN